MNLGRLCSHSVPQFSALSYENFNRTYFLVLWYKASISVQLLNVQTNKLETWQGCLQRGDQMAIGEGKVEGQFSSFTREGCFTAHGEYLLSSPVIDHRSLFPQPSYEVIHYSVRKQASDSILKLSKHLLACKHQHSHTNCLYSQRSPAPFPFGSSDKQLAWKVYSRQNAIIPQQQNSGPIVRANPCTLYSSHFTNAK